MQESICSRQSETGNKAVGVRDILDELDEAQKARAPVTPLQSSFSLS